MGLYAVDCKSCNKPFQWFSGNNPGQLCSECQDLENPLLKGEKENRGDLFEQFEKFIGSQELVNFLAKVQDARVVGYEANRVERSITYLNGTEAWTEKDRPYCRIVMEISDGSIREKIDFIAGNIDADLVDRSPK